MDDIFRGIGVKIQLHHADDFLKVRETLTRIGIASKKDMTLYQSCHILHKQGKYAIVHFKEMFKLDGKVSDICENDIARRNTIASLLEEWGLVKILDQNLDNKVPNSCIKIIPHRDKANWNLVSKYNIGKS